eukprot:2436355-Amphidinium_carterae.1
MSNASKGDSSGNGLAEHSVRELKAKTCKRATTTSGGIAQHYVGAVRCYRSLQFGWYSLRR